MSEKMMICPKHATCQRTCKEIGLHCGPHTKTTGCEHGSNFCPPCVPVKVKIVIEGGKKDAEPQTCRWTKDDGTWFSGCAEAFNFGISDESPLKNGFKFCPFCGRKIEEVGR